MKPSGEVINLAAMNNNQVRQAKVRQLECSYGRMQLGAVTVDTAVAQ